jgi:hypothetical protein
VTLDKAERILKELGADWSLTEELLARNAAFSRVLHTELSIPVCVAVQIALVRLLRVASLLQPVQFIDASTDMVLGGTADSRVSKARENSRSCRSWQTTAGRSMSKA